MNTNHTLVSSLKNVFNKNAIFWFILATCWIESFILLRFSSIKTLEIHFLLYCTTLYTFSTWLFLWIENLKSWRWGEHRVEKLVREWKLFQTERNLLNTMFCFKYDFLTFTSFRLLKIYASFPLILSRSDKLFFIWMLAFFNMSQMRNNDNDFIFQLIKLFTA